MKALILAFMFCIPLIAADPVTPVPTVTPSPSVTPLNTPTVTPNGTGFTVTAETKGPSMIVPEPAAPPVWAQDVMVAVVKLPVVGPIAAKVLLWSGIISAILTSLVSCILGVLAALKGVFNLTGLSDASQAVEKFRTGRFMYWLMFLSMFNGKKPVKLNDGPTV